jgi:5'-nucleotidase
MGASPKSGFRVFAMNDDGIMGEGLIELARQLAPRCVLTIVAPESPRSAASHSITLHKPLRVNERSDFPWPQGAQPGCVAYSCSGSPSDCVMLGVLELLKDKLPHLVVSGINDGQNLAEDITYSGTVAGAMEGALLGLPAISISLDTKGLRSFDTAAQLLLQVVTRVFFGDAASQVMPAPSSELAQSVFNGSRFLNINVPDLPLAQVKGVRVCSTGFRGYKDVVQQMTDPRGRPIYWIAGERVQEDTREDADVVLIQQGYATISPLTWNLTDYAAVPMLDRLLSR